MIKVSANHDLGLGQIYLKIKNVHYQYLAECALPQRLAEYCLLPQNRQLGITIYDKGFS